MAEIDFLSRYIRSVRLRSPVDEASYLARLPAVRALEQGLDFQSGVTFLVGENGAGKSTLIEAIAVAYGFNPEGGTRNFNFSTRDSHSELWRHLTLVKGLPARDGFFLRAESFYNVASNIDAMDEEPSFGPPIADSYGGVSLHMQSHGESFLALVQNRFGGNGLYLLDEPEAALSPMRLMTLIAEIARLVKQHSQFIIATHSPILMAYPGAQVLELSAEHGVRCVDFRETEHYQITRRFLENPEKMLKYLLDE